MDAIAYDSRLNEQVTGRVAVLEDRFEKVLGPNAYLTWQILCAHRNARGMTTITIRGMRRTKRFEILKDHQIKRALVRLRKAGLVRDLVRSRIRMRRPVGRQGKTAVVWAFPRRIYGARAAGLTGAMVLVPGWVWRWLKVAKCHGGARENTGPRKAWAKMPTLGAPIGASDPIQSVPHQKSSRCTPDIYKRSVGYGSYRGAVAPLASLEGQQSVASNAPASPLLMTKHPAQGNVGTGKSQENVRAGIPQKNVGSRIGGAGRPPPPPGTNGVPPYPGPTVCPPALIPSPPELPAGLSNLERAEWLAKAFRGAVQSRYKKRCWVLAGRGKLEKSKYLKLLMEAAELLDQYGVPPAAWAAFSVDQWRRNEMGKGQPRLNWVYSHKRIEDQHGWGRREGYSSKRAVYSKPAQDMMARYKCMRVALAQAGAQTRQEVAAVVEQWFPGGLYEDLRRRAHQRAVEDQLLINARVRRGEWIW